MPLGVPGTIVMSFRCTGAKHLYVIDYNGDELPALAEELESRYPRTKVGLHGFS